MNGMHSERSVKHLIMLIVKYEADESNVGEIVFHESVIKRTLNDAANMSRMCKDFQQFEYANRPYKYRSVCE